MTVVNITDMNDIDYFLLETGINEGLLDNKIKDCLEWEKIGYSLFHHNNEYFNIFNTLSKRRHSYNEETTLLFWNSIRSKNIIPIQINTIYKYMKDCNSLKFNDIKKRFKLGYNLIDEDLYLKYKDIHEKQYFKVNNPLSYFKILNDNELQTLSETQLKLMLKDCSYKFNNPKLNFYDMWSHDCDKRKYDNIVFEPYGIKSNNNNLLDSYNTFTGFKYDREITNELDKDNCKFLQLIKHLTVNKDVNNYFLDWISMIIQKPNKKTNWMVVLYSKMGGIGKNGIIDMLIKLIGYSSKLEKIDDISKNFNALSSNKLLIYGDEIDAAARKLADLLKNIITRSEIVIEKKELMLIF